MQIVKFAEGRQWSYFYIKGHTLYTCFCLTTDKQSCYYEKCASLSRHILPRLYLDMFLIITTIHVFTNYVVIKIVKVGMTFFGKQRGHNVFFLYQLITKIEKETEAKILAEQSYSSCLYFFFKIYEKQHLPTFKLIETSIQHTPALYQ